MAQKRKRIRRQNAPQNARWIIAGAALVVVALVVLVVASQMSTKSVAAPVFSSPEPAALDKCGKPECGQPGAPVTIEEYADFQCPYCAQEDQVLQQIAPKYIDTGKARLVYNNMVLIGPESQPAAEAAECAGDQNKFWTYGNYLFTHQQGENTGAFSTDNLKKIAALLGLNTSAFNSCLDSGKYTALVKQQTAQGQQRGVTGTPTLFINGKKYEGALPADQLSSIIDTAQPQ